MLSAWEAQHSAHDLNVLERICITARAAIELIHSLDTSSESELFIDAVCTGPMRISEKNTELVGDLVGALLEQGGWHHLDLPAIADREGSDRAEQVSSAQGRRV